MGTQRTAYGEALIELARQDDRIVVLEADLGKSTMSYPFSQAFPERYFEMGIAEANMTSFAAGLALAGKVAFTNSFAMFSGGRAFDQIRQSVCTAGLNVKIQGSSAGLSDYGDGGSHQTVEDIAIIRAIPRMTVLVPMDTVETRKMVFAAAAHEGPVYLRISRNEIEDRYPEDRPFVIGEPYVLREGTDVSLLACGIMVNAALKAAEQLAADGISAQVVNVSTLKPFPDEAVRKLTAGKRLTVTCEEHSYIGGLSAAAAWALRGTGMPLEAVAIDDRFGQSAANAGELLRAYHLTPEDISAKVTLCLTK